jgi:thiol-disulfide isomerase/thioredoxin
MRSLLVVVSISMIAACTTSRVATRDVAAADPALDHDLVGRTPSAWKTEAWVNSPPLTLGGLRGKVVLVRWFMGTSCPFCSATAPSLKKLHHDYADKGLVVIGMYHHKDDAPLTDAQYVEYVRSYGFTFPVARDPDWNTLRAWWLEGHDREFTSVSFLLDKSGRVRGIHPGGRYAPGDAAYEAMRRGIEKLLGEPSPGT